MFQSMVKRGELSWARTIIEPCPCPASLVAHPCPDICSVACQTGGSTNRRILLVPKAADNYHQHTTRLARP
jgi:hypothetical protein